MSGDKVYLDTSALLPYYREEPVSRQVQDFLAGLRPPVLISDLTRVEMASVIARWVRMGEIEEPQAGLIENTFAGDIGFGLLVQHSLSSGDYQQAEKWLLARKTGLRTLDALHLSCCRSLRARLVTCDSAMHQAAEALGMESICISPG